MEKRGWLIDPQGKMVAIYRANQAVEVLQNLTHLSEEKILPNLILNLPKILG